MLCAERVEPMSGGVFTVRYHRCLPLEGFSLNKQEALCDDQMSETTDDLIISHLFIIYVLDKMIKYSTLCWHQVFRCTSRSATGHMCVLCSAGHRSVIPEFVDLQ